ncbi:ubiquinone biosynthesis protein COQ9, mitochondrial-like [Styela clava]
MLIRSRLPLLCAKAFNASRCTSAAISRWPENHKIYLGSSTASHRIITYSFRAYVTTTRMFSSDGNSGFTENEEAKSRKDGDHNAENGKCEDDIRVEILENALNYVLTHGWTREALSLGAQEAGYPSVTEGMFSRGEVDLVLYLVKSNNTNLLTYMEEILDAQEGEKIRISEFIRDVLEYRLRMIIPYIEVWSDAMAILLRPTVFVEATQELGKMVDDIWFYAEDTSTDFNWYTKRALLAKLFLTTQTVMVNDQSPDFADTWKFLDRRMSDIATIGKVSSSLQKNGKMAGDVAFAGFTVLRNVTGFGDRRR